MAGLRSTLLHTICAGLCLAGVTPASLLPGGRPAAPRRGGEADAAPAQSAGRTPSLQERLAGHEAQPVALPPLVDSPRPLAGAIVPVPYRTWLPPAALPPTPRVVRSDGQQRPLRVRPAVDVPPVASDANPKPPAPIQLAAGPAPRIESPDPSRQPLPSLAGRGGADRPTLATDPAADRAPPAALNRTPPLRQAPAPPLLGKIPDPSPQPAGADVRTTLTDDGQPPVASPDLPAKPTLSPKK